MRQADGGVERLALLSSIDHPAGVYGVAAGPSGEVLPDLCSHDQSCGTCSHDQSCDVSMTQISHVDLHSAYKVLTAGEDRTARVFSMDPARAVSMEELQLFQAKAA